MKSPARHGSFDATTRERQARHLVLSEFGPEGLSAMQRARVLLIGAGGLGVPCATYLVGCGLGHLTVVDPAKIDPPDLARQFAYGLKDVGRWKVDVLRERLTLAASVTDATNGTGTAATTIIEAVRGTFDPSSAACLVEGADLVVDASDNPATRFLVSDACVMRGRPLVSGAASRVEGVVMHLCGNDRPCYRCLVPVSPSLAHQPTCADEGVLAPVTGIVGAWMALEAVRRLTDGLPKDTPTSWHLDLAGPAWHAVHAQRDRSCAACGTAPTISSLRLESAVCAPGDPFGHDPDGWRDATP